MKYSSARGTDKILAFADLVWQDVERGTVVLCEVVQSGRDMY